MPETLLPSLQNVSGETEKVGPGRPPRAHRFRPGQSGNPRGRPKRSLSELMARALGEMVEATENGRRRRITKLQAALTQLANRAASGDHRATQYAFVLRGDPGREPPPAAEPPSSDGDALVIAEMVRRLSRPRE